MEGGTPQVAWTPELELGVELIDAQHRELFARAALFLDASARGEGTRHVLETLGFLSGYAVRHFETEEEFMATSGYPDLALHQREHGAFCETLKRLTMLFARQGLTPHLASATAAELVGWLDRHVRTTDLALGAWLRSRGRA